MNLHCVAND